MVEVGQLDVGEYLIYYSGEQSMDHFESSFVVYRKLVLHIIELRSISERLSLLMLDTKNGKHMHS